jgi:hypothetical protein
MGNLIYVPQYVDIKKSTYDKAYKRFQKNLEGKSFGEIVTANLDFYDTYLKVPIYKDSGILAQIKGSEIIEYKYKKKLKTDIVYACGSKEYECLQDIVNKSR